jgi:hypothetical protein
MRPLSQVPPWVPLLLAGAVALQLALPPAPAPARPQALAGPPSTAALRLASAGDPAALAKVLLLHLQAQDASLSFSELDYLLVREWLARMLALDPQAQAPLLAASHVYAAVGDPARTRVMLEFVYERFADDPARRWPWLAQAALVARHRLHDEALAQKYAQALRAKATAPGVPAWVREL